MQIQKLINPPLEMSPPLYGSVLCLGNRNDARRFPKGQRPAPTNRAVVKRRFGRELRAMQCCLFRGPGSTSAGPSRVRHTCGAYMGHSRSWPKWLRERERERQREKFHQQRVRSTPGPIEGTGFEHVVTHFFGSPAHRKLSILVRNCFFRLPFHREVSLPYDATSVTLMSRGSAGEVGNTLIT